MKNKLLKFLINTVLVLLSVFIAYFLVEVVYSWLYVKKIIKPVETLWFHEVTDPGGNFKYDTVAGYRISQTPARYGAVLSDGTLESIGVLKGNNLGFPDKRDFEPQKNNPQLKRIAVFGDSYTASQFTDRSWPDIAEDKINGLAYDSVVFMNFSVDGGGLANWHSIIRNIILGEGYQIDAVIFAVMGDDLDRKFMWKNDYRQNASDKKLAFNYLGNWQQKKAAGFEDVSEVMYMQNYLILDSVQIDAIEKGTWSYDRQRELKPYLYEALKKALRQINFPKIFRNKQHGSTPSVFEPEQAALIKDLSDAISEMQVPVLTLSLYTNENRCQAFAAMMHAAYLSDAGFRQSLETIEEDKIYIKNDGHWKQEGAALYAEYIYKDIYKWMAEKRVIEQ
ncbi:MAG: hypothetical protein BWY70_00905 [Bacteroidetes bacterium ADurb.Bin408]|nr:MAG: hypothetical protein BWY70_00905 [Bacteroidetes bacterium ADurb.Bin408]